MNFSDAIIIILGLTLFEIISSVDNAIVNADVLATMSEKSRRWFLFYGIIIAVFLVRGALPLLIVYFSNPSISLYDAFFATINSDQTVLHTIEKNKPILLSGGGIYLVFLFMHWLFLEKKEFAFFLEQHIVKRYSFWFYAAASIILLLVTWLTIHINPLIGFGAIVGSTVFFITNGFKKNAEEKERELKTRHLSDLSKIMYLEVIDTSFSIDGVLGAFAFTISIPLIIIGNGLGAFIVRYFTVNGIKTVKKYRYLKNGAMYSIGSLGAIMLGESLGWHIYTFVPSAITFFLVGLFFWLSVQELRIEKAIK